MGLYDRHPSSDRLLRAIDGELSPRRRSSLDRHLAGCESCRLRLQAMARAATDVGHLVGDEAAPDPDEARVLRERVRASVRQLSATMDRSWRVRIAEGFATLPRAAGAGALLVAIVVAAQLVRPTPESSSSEIVLSSIESGALPVRSLTPGAAGNADAAVLCADHLPVRPDVPAAVRSAVLRDYQMEQVPEREYELDYLITPELGGIADRHNLWPERYGARVWNARVKDELEQLLPRLVCEGRLDLATAQHDMALDWIAAYKKYFHTDRPLTRQSRVVAADGDDDVRATPTMP